jgi:hypothetical protein
MQHTNWAPIPCFPNFPCDVAVYSRGMYNGHISYIMDDRDVDYPSWQSSYESLSTSSTDSP